MYKSKRQRIGELGPDLVDIISECAITKIRIYSNDGAFAAVLKNKQVVTWGDVDKGGEIPVTDK